MDDWDKAELADAQERIAELECALLDYVDDYFNIDPNADPVEWWTERFNDLLEPAREK